MEFEKSIVENIKARYSCRSYDSKPLDETLVKKLQDYIEEMNAQIKTRARFQYITNDTNNETPVKLGTYGMIAGANNYIVGICHNGEQNCVEFGYMFEKIILFATDMNLQTCWLGGTFNRDEFTKKCNLKDNEYIAIVSPVGIKKQKPRIFDKAVRTLVGADKRKPFSELFFDNDISTPLDENNAGEYKTPLEMVRLGPSASNKQPCRIIKSDNGYNFYLNRTKAYAKGPFDMQKNDIGIAMCHFELTAKEMGLKGQWENMENRKNIVELEYISTWVIAK